MNPLERHIREKLEGHRPDLPADAWQRFSHHLEAEERFDQVLRDKLSRHEARYRPAHWRSMRERLDRRARMLRELQLARGLELVLLALLMYTLGNLPHTGLPTAWEGRKAAAAPATREPAASNVPMPADGKERAASGTPTPRSDQDLVPALFLSNTPAGSQAILASPESGTASIPLDESADAPAFSAPAATPSAAMKAPLPMDGPVIPAATTMPIATIEVSEIPNETPWLQVPLVKAPRHFRHRISMALGRDLHHILTPYDHLLSNRGYDQWAGGNSGSFGYTWEGRKWGIRTHLAYHHLGYLPKPFTEVFDGDMQRGYFTESIRTIELNLLSIDLQASRSIARLGHWNLYAVVGIAGHMAILANYDRRQEFLPGTDPVPDGEIPQPTQPSRISQKRFADGIIEGGGFAENSFLTVDGGVGFERHLNGRISLFQENMLRINPFLRSLGPNNDRINSLGLTAGVRVLI